MIIDILGEEIDYEFIKSKFQLHLNKYIINDHLDQFVLRSNNTSDVLLINLTSFFKDVHNFIMADFDNYNVLLEFDEPSIKFNFHHSLLDIIIRLINLIVPYKREIHTNDGFMGIMYLTTLKKISVRIDQEYDLYPLTNILDYQVDINDDFVVLMANNTFPLSSNFLMNFTEQLGNLISKTKIENTNNMSFLIEKLNKLNKKEILFFRFFNTFLSNQISNLIDFKVIEDRYKKYYDTNYESKYFILKDSEILFYSLKLADFMGLNEEDFLLSYLIFNRLYLSYTTITDNYLELFTYSIISYFYFCNLSVNTNLNTGKKLLKELFILFSINFIDLADIERTRIYVIFRSVLTNYQNGRITVLFDNLIKIINSKDNNIVNYLSKFIHKKYNLHNLNFIDLKSGFKDHPFILYYLKDGGTSKLNSKVENFYFKNLFFDNAENWLFIKMKQQVKEVLPVNIFSISYNDNLLFPDFNNSISKLISINSIDKVKSINMLIGKLMNLISYTKNEIVLMYIGTDEILLKIYTNDHAKFSHL